MDVTNFHQTTRELSVSKYIQIKIPFINKCFDLLLLRAALLNIPYWFNRNRIWTGRWERRQDLIEVAEVIHSSSSLLGLSRTSGAAGSSYASFSITVLLHNWSPDGFFVCICMCVCVGCASTHDNIINADDTTRGEERRKEGNGPF